LMEEKGLAAFLAGIAGMGIGLILCLLGKALLFPEGVQTLPAVSSIAATMPG
jgi:hypothetical protein